MSHLQMEGSPPEVVGRNGNGIVFKWAMIGDKNR
jgi:hypothetical protein